MYKSGFFNVKRIFIVIFLSLLIGAFSFNETTAAILNNNLSEYDANTINLNINYNELYNSKNFYEDYIKSIEMLEKKYYMLEHLLNVKDIGQSADGKTTKAIVVGNPKSDIKITINATGHQEKHINTILVLNQIDYLLQMYLDDESFEGQRVKKILANVQIWFVPIVNSDAYTSEDITMESYNPEGELYDNSLEIAKILESRRGYTLSTVKKIMSVDFGGYKDWLIMVKKIPAVTIETDKDALEPNDLKPVDWRKYASIWNDNKNIPLSISNYFYNLEDIENDYTEVNLSPVNIRILGNEYVGESFIINGKTFIRYHEFISSINDKNIINTPKPLKTRLFINKSNLDKEYIYIGTKKYILLRDIAVSNNFEVIWDNDSREVIIDKKENLLSIINPLWVSATIVRDSIIFKDENMQEQIDIFKEGSKVTLIQDRSEKIANVKFGEISGWVKYLDIKVSQHDYLKNMQIKPYIKEFFVNETGYISDTNKLIWINLENTEVNIFEKSEERWNLIKSIECSIGSNNTPTINGVFKYNRYVPIETSDDYYVSDVMKFYKAFGIHSVLMKNNGDIYDGRLKMAISHGCIRMLPEDIIWLRDNCEIETTVVVW